MTLLITPLAPDNEVCPECDATVFPCVPGPGHDADCSHYRPRTPEVLRRQTTVHRREYVVVVVAHPRCFRWRVENRVGLVLYDSGSGHKSAGSAYDAARRYLRDHYTPLRYS